MLEEKKEMVKPFVIDHDAIGDIQKNSMVPDSDDTEKSVADELKIPEKKKDEKEIMKEEEKKEEKPQKKLLESAKKAMIKPFEILAEGAADPTQKMYLVLLYINSNDDNVEDSKDFFFIRGRQDVFDALKDALENYNADAMRSLIFVDSPKVTISTRTSVYKFMKDMIDTNRVLNDSDFDIQDYYYDIKDIEREE